MMSGLPKYTQINENWIELESLQPVSTVRYLDLHLTANLTYFKKIEQSIIFMFIFRLPSSDSSRKISLL